METPASEQTYHVVSFQQSEEAAAFVAALSRFLASPRGSVYMQQPHRAEVWLATSQSGVDLFLNDGALHAASAVFAPVPVADTRPGAALPPDCALVLGGGRAPAWGLVDAQRHLTTH